MPAAILATRAGQLVNYPDLSNDTGVSDVTIRHRLHALEISNIIVLLPAYYRNIGKRLIKSPKIYSCDHGLLSYLLGIESQAYWQKSPFQASIWENIILLESMKTNFLRPRHDLFLYRDQNGVEIDFIVLSKVVLCFIEAKSGERFYQKKPIFIKFYRYLRIKLEPSLLQHKIS